MSDRERPESESESILPEEQKISGLVAFPSSPTGWAFWFPSPDRMTMTTVDYIPQFTPLPPSPPPFSDTLWEFSDHSLPSSPTMEPFSSFPYLKLPKPIGLTFLIFPRLRKFYFRQMQIQYKLRANHIKDNEYPLKVATLEVLNGDLYYKALVEFFLDGVEGLHARIHIQESTCWVLPETEKIVLIKPNDLCKIFGEEIPILELSWETAAVVVATSSAARVDFADAIDMAAAKDQDNRERPFRICASGDKSFDFEDPQVYNAPIMNSEAADNIDDKNHSSCKKQKLHVTTSDGRNVSSLAQALNAATAAVGQQNKGKTELNTLKMSRENITLADIEHFRGKTTLLTAAHSFGVSKSTLKRRCRELDILDWRSTKIKKGEDSGGHTNLPITTKQEIPSSTQRGVLYDGSRPGYVTVKARNQGNYIKFVLPVSSKMDDLVCEVKQRINIEVGEFRIKYKDEDDDLITVTCDDDWKLCMCTMGSQAKIQMLIEPSNDLV